MNGIVHTESEPIGEVTACSMYPFKVGLFGLVFFTGTLKSRTTERVE